MKNVISYKNFAASISFSAEDEVLYGKVAGINDLVTFEGNSVKELKIAFKEAIDDYLDTCKRLGKDPLKTYKGSFNIRIPTILHKEIAEAAFLHNQTLNEFVKNALLQSLEKEKTH